MASRATDHKLAVGLAHEAFVTRVVPVVAQLAGPVEVVLALCLCVDQSLRVDARRPRK